MHDPHPRTASSSVGRRHTAARHHTDDPRRTAAPCLADVPNLADVPSHTSRTRRTAPRQLLGSVVALAVAASLTACGAGSDAASQLTSQADVAAAETSDESSAVVDDTSTDGTSTDGEADGESPYPSADGDGDGTSLPAATSGIEIDPTWTPLLEPRFVSRAPIGSIISLYAEPSTDAEVVGSVRAGESGLILFDVVEEVDDRVWSPVQTSDGAVGWIKNGLLRPEPSISPPERIGDSPLRGSDTIQVATSGLSAPEVLADLIDDRGLTMSSDAFIGEDAVVLGAEQLRTPRAEDTTVLTWGFEAGVGDPIEATMSERLAELAGSTAVTSTEAEGFNVQVGVGNIPSNITEVFPGAEWVELHFSGTEAFGGLDWQSITFVFDTTGETPVLLAITAASWSP